MSHTMNIKTEIRDMDALKIACNRLGLRIETGTFQLYNTTEEGTAVYLPGWKYPAVIRAGGEIAYDTFGGKWGDDGKLNELKAYYGLEKAKKEARKKGYSVYEKQVSNGQMAYLELRIRP